MFSKSYMKRNNFKRYLWHNDNIEFCDRMQNTRNKLTRFQFALRTGEVSRVTDTVMMRIELKRGHNGIESIDCLHKYKARTRDESSCLLCVNSITSSSVN